MSNDNDNNKKNTNNNSDGVAIVVEPDVDIENQNIMDHDVELNNKDNTEELTSTLRFRNTKKNSNNSNTQKRNKKKNKTATTTSKLHKSKKSRDPPANIVTQINEGDVVIDAYYDPDNDNDNDNHNRNNDDDDDDSTIAPFLHNSKNNVAEDKLTDSQRLVVDKRVYNMSLMAMRLGVFADTVNGTILGPNYVFMVNGSSDDSFTSTAPFDVASAQYFIPMCTLLATAIAGVYAGDLSDKIGRRPVMIVCIFMGAVGSIIQYLCRKNFWAFCAANIFTGIFGATLAISIAYASDVASTRIEKDGVIGSLVGIAMIGATGGGIVAIAMSGSGLFTPLFVGAGLNLVATIYAYLYLVEPDKLLERGIISNDVEDEEDDEEEDEKTTETSNKLIMAIIIFGSILDNAGSTGLVPFCLSPLMFDTYLGNFLAIGEEPIMSPNAYKWLTVLVALMIIPAASSSAMIFDKIGAPAGCVIGNFLTGCITIALLLITFIDPPTNASYAGFIVVLYVGFPLTVLSQLSTGPMIDRISPPSRRGFYQGVNTAAMNGGQAVFPWVFGLIADAIGVKTTIWISVGVSFAAAFANAPLLFVDSLRKKVYIPDWDRTVGGDTDKDLVERALTGNWIPAAALDRINEERIKAGKHQLAIPVLPYEEDKKNLKSLKRHAKGDYKYYSDTFFEIIGSSEFDTYEKRKTLIDAFKKSEVSEEKRKEIEADLGKWFIDYMQDGGYYVHGSVTIVKQMIISAFPRMLRMSETEVTPENVEQLLLNMARLYKHMLEKEEYPPFVRAFAKSGIYARD